MLKDLKRYFRKKDIIPTLASFADVKEKYFSGNLTSYNIRVIIIDIGTLFLLKIFFTIVELDRQGPDPRIRQGLKRQKK